jgi:hypothetical protein
MVAVITTFHAEMICHIYGISVLSQSKISLKQHLLTKFLLYRQQIHRHQP